MRSPIPRRSGSMRLTWRPGRRKGRCGWRHCSCVPARLRPSATWWPYPPPGLLPRSGPAPWTGPRADAGRATSRRMDDWQTERREVITFRAAGIRGPILRLTDNARTKRRRPPEIIALLVAVLLLGVGLVYVVTQYQRPSPGRFGISDPELITKSGKVQASELAAMKAIGITSIG